MSNDKLIGTIRKADLIQFYEANKNSQIELTIKSTNPENSPSNLSISMVITDDVINVLRNYDIDPTHHTASSLIETFIKKNLQQ
jgi:hypothetical protein